MADAVAYRRSLNDPLFHPPFELLPFQADYAARCYFNENTLLGPDTGLGKSVICMATACMLFEDGLIDTVVVGCESNKIGEWEDDFGSVTSLRTQVYSGRLNVPPLKRIPKTPKPPRSRTEMCQRINEFDVLIGTFETLRDDFAVWGSPKKNTKRDKSLYPGPLTEALKGRRILYILDEAPAKIGASRTSQTYRANQMFLKECRKAGEVKVVIPSATPVDRDPHGYFNLVSLFKNLGTQTQFYEEHVSGWDDYHQPRQFKNLTPDACEPGCISLKEKVGPILLLKSKNDPDVIKLFPKEAPPEFTHVRLSDAETEFYKWMCKEYADDQEGGIHMTLRQFLGHPAALLRSQAGVAQDIAERVGEERLRALGASKAEALIERLKMLVQGQGEQVVVFTFFGQSVLPELQRMMLEVGLKVGIHHGKMRADAKTAVQRTFRAGETEVFLSSDAGARGINLQTASYVEQYEWPKKYTNSIQRINRVRRLGSTRSIVFSHVWTVKDTLEQGSVNLMLKRKGWGEELTTDSPISNAEIRARLKESRERVG